MQPKIIHGDLKAVCVIHFTVLLCIIYGSIGQCTDYRCAHCLYCWLWLSSGVGFRNRKFLELVKRTRQWWIAAVDGSRTLQSRRGCRGMQRYHDRHVCFWLRVLRGLPFELDHSKTSLLTWRSRSSQAVSLFTISQMITRSWVELSPDANLRTPFSLNLRVNLAKVWGWTMICGVSLKIVGIFNLSIVQRQTKLLIAYREKRKTWAPRMAPAPLVSLREVPGRI